MLVEIEKGYFVDELGNVYSKRKFSKLTKLKQYTNDDVYKKVWLYISGKKKMEFVHRLVAKAFVPNPSNLPMINHKNSIRDDNRVDNLEWCDGLYNQRYSWEYNNRKSYTGHKDKGNDKFSSEWIKLYKEGLSFRSIAKKYGTSHHTVARVIRYFSRLETT